MPISEVYLGDCMDHMRLLPDKYFDLAIVDPPYRSKNQPTKSMREKTNGTMKNFGLKPTKEYFNELFRISKNQIVWGGNYFIDDLYSTDCILFWDKVTQLNNYADGEMAWTSFSSPAKNFRYVWSGNRYGFEDSIEGVGEPTNRIHPTQKPVALYKWLLKNYAKEGDKILDTHGGSMSSVIACLEMGFEITCYEKDPDYYLAAKKRIEQYLAQGNLFKEKGNVIFG